jgi:hypothetical protein
MDCRPSPAAPAVGFSSVGVPAPLFLEPGQPCPVPRFAQPRLEPRLPVPGPTGLRVPRLFPTGSTASAAAPSTAHGVRILCIVAETTSSGLTISAASRRSPAEFGLQPARPGYGSTGLTKPPVTDADLSLFSAPVAKTPPRVASPAPEAPAPQQAWATQPPQPQPQHQPQPQPQPQSKSDDGWDNDDFGISWEQRE